MWSPDITPTERTLAAMRQSRERLVQALDQFESAQDYQQATALVGRASDEVGRASYHLRRLIREQTQ